MDARPELDHVEGFRDEVLGAGLQRAQLVPRLGGDHDHGQVSVGVAGLQAFHDLESVHDRHLQVEQDQVVLVFTVHRAHFLRIHRRGNAGVPGFAQHLLEQDDVGFLIVDDENACPENASFIDAHERSFFNACPTFAWANVSAMSSASMK